MTHAARPSHAPAQALTHSPLEHWQRVGLGIRLAYNPAKADVLRYWLAHGVRLTERRLIDEVGMLKRCLRLLMQTAHDEALPWYWRSVCLEHTAGPLARLTTLLRLHDPLEGEALHAFVQAAHERLAAAADAPGRR